MLLPAPFSPSSASTSPRASVSEMASFATRLPKRFVIDSRRSTGAPAVSVTSTLHFAVGFGWLSSTFTV